MKLRYYYRIDERGNPIPGSLRSGFRIPRDRHFVEIANSCCNPVDDNDAPVASSLSITGTTATGQTLTGHYTYSDTEGDTQGTSIFRWYRADNTSGLNRIAIPGATSITYVLGSADAGKYIQFAVTPKSGTGTTTGTQMRSTYTSVITGSDVTAPTVTSMTATDGNHITVVFSEASTGTVAGWSFSNGSPLTITSRSGSGTGTWIFTLSSTIVNGETVTASYAPGDVVDGASNPLVAFTGASVTNSVVPPSITARWMSTNVDPHTNLSGSVDPYTYTGSATLVSNSSNIVIDVHDASAYPDNNFFVIKVPSAVTNKTLWADDPTNAPFNNGSIPDSNFRSMVTFGGFDYYYSRVGMIFDHTSNSRVTLS